MDLTDAITALDRFSGQNLTQTISRIEMAIERGTAESCQALLLEHHAQQDALVAAGLVKRRAGQINVIIHALGILLCLPKMLQPGEVIESVSLGAGNTGKPFDLETNRRIAEFKFITWQGGSDAIRQNSIFKDFYYLMEHDSAKAKHLYVLGTEFPLKFLNGGRALKSVLSKDVNLYNAFITNHPECRVVRDYYMPRRDQVLIEDISSMLPGLACQL